MKTILCISVLLLLVPVANAAPLDAKLANDLKQIGLAYHTYLADTNKAPAKAKDLASYLDNDKRILGLLDNEDVVFFFNVTTTQMRSGTSKTVLAYEKDVPSKGGVVLMGDGSVKTMPPEEFRKATLAGKRKEKDK
jgi:hypothetical protein